MKKINLNFTKFIILWQQKSYVNIDKLWRRERNFNQPKLYLNVS